MMWGVLANYGDIATFSVETLARSRLICCRNVYYVNLASILTYFGYCECTIVRPLDEINTSCCILSCLYDFTLK